MNGLFNAKLGGAEALALPIGDLDSVASAEDMRATVNALLHRSRAWDNAQGGGAVTVLISEGNVIISSEADVDDGTGVRVPVYHGLVADEAAMLALHAPGGPFGTTVFPMDTCRRADTESLWMCIANNGTVLEDWIEMGGGGGAPATWSLHPVTAGNPPVTTYTIDSAVLVGNVLTGAELTVTGLTGIVLGVGTNVWLSGAFTTGSPTGWAVTTVGPVGADRFTWNASNQQLTSFLLLGRVISGLHPNKPGFGLTLGAAPYHYEQLCSVALLVSWGCINGRVAARPSPN